MFRLVKVLNSNTQCETQLIKCNSSHIVGRGCALTLTSGVASPPAATSAPEFISLASNAELEDTKVPAMIVTEDMVFKVEYNGNVTPTVGMTVGLGTIEYKMDSVTYSSNGKGTVIGIDEDKRFVYVKFRK